MDQGKKVKLWVEALDVYIRQVERELLHREPPPSVGAIKIGWDRDDLFFLCTVAEVPDGGTIDYRAQVELDLPRLDTQEQFIAMVEQIVALPCYASLPRASEVVFRQDHPRRGTHEVVVQSGQAQTQ